MKPFSLKMHGKGEPTTLFIGGATYDYENDFAPLAEEVDGTCIVANNPFQDAERKRPDDWESQLVHGYIEVCEQHGITDLVAHSRGDLQAIMMAGKRTFESLVLLHPPLKKCPTTHVGRLNLPIGNPMKTIDEILTPTSDGISDEAYRKMVFNHYNRYGSDPERKALMNILRHDVQPLINNEEMTKDAIRKVEEEITARVLVIVGNNDPWHSTDLSEKKKTIVTLNQGHYSHIAEPSTVANIINTWRSGKDVSPFNQVRSFFQPAISEPTTEEAETYGF